MHVHGLVACHPACDCLIVMHCKAFGEKTGVYVCVSYIYIYIYMCVCVVESKIGQMFFFWGGA